MKIKVIFILFFISIFAWNAFPSNSIYEAFGSALFFTTFAYCIYELIMFIPWNEI